MKKKMFVAMTLAMVTILATLTGCTIRSSYDERIINSAEKTWENLGYASVENPFEKGDRKFEIKEEESEGKFEVNLDGTRSIILNEGKVQRGEYSPKSIKPLDKREKSLYESSKEKVVEYIESSEILENKEEFKNFLDKVTIRMATYSEDELVGAYYDNKTNTIFVNELSEDQVCEWMFTHELIHALAYKTHGESEYTYMYTQFTEVMTDIITSSLDPELLEDELVISGYVPQYWLVYPIFTIFQDEALKGYWYGWEKFFIDEKLDKDEFDLYVLVVANYGQENSEAYFNNLLLKWEAAANK